MATPLTFTITFSRILLLSCSIMLTACAMNDPLTYSTKAEDQLNSLSAWEQSTSNAQQAKGLLDLINSTQVESYVQLGLANNPSLKQTALAINIAQLAVTGARGETIPQLDLTLNQQKNEAQSSTYNAQLGVSWAVDIWGKLQDAVDAEKTGVASSIAANKYARDLLAASIIDNWLQQVQAYQLIANQADHLKVLEDNEKAIVGRYRKGLDELADLDTARTSSASARATLASYKEQLNVLKRAMITFTGGDKTENPTISTYPVTIVPLASFPAQDLGRRPDLQQAFLALQTAELNTAIAYKNLLPSLSLSGSLTNSDASLSEALLGSSAWGLLSELTTPIFQGGKLKAQAKSAELVAEQSFWAYQQALLQAVNEVEDALGNENTLAEQQLHIETALINVQRSIAIYEDKYRQGLASFLDLLNVQSQAFDLQQQHIKIIYQRLTNRIILGLALGLGV